MATEHGSIQFAAGIAHPVASRVKATAGTGSASPATGAAPSSTRSSTAATVRYSPRLPGPSSTAPPPRDIWPSGPGGWPRSTTWIAREENGRTHEDDAQSHGEAVSVLIFRLGEEWLAFRTQAIAEVTTPRPVHRVPHRSNQVFVGLVNLQGQVQLCVSLHGLLGVSAPSDAGAAGRAA